MTDEATGPKPLSRARTLTLAIALLFSMFLGTFPQYALGVLAPLLVAETEITDFHIGFVASMLYLTAAAVAWFSGRLIDARSSRRTLSALYSTAAMTLVMFATTNSLAWLLLAVMVGGIAVGANNPATNRVIANFIPQGQRAFVLSTKQIGVKIAHLSTGLLIPLFALTLGWRPGLIAFALSMLVISLILVRAVPTERAAGGTSSVLAPDPEVKRQVRWLRIYAISMAVGMAAISTYLPLYAVREVGLDFAVTGLIVSSMGGFAVATRIFWAFVTERTGKPALIMMILAIVGTASLALTAAATVLGPWALWVGAIAAGGTVGSWNVVAHLTIVNDVDKTRAAAATGYMQATFLIGLAAGAPVFGIFIRLFGSYSTAWAFAAALSLFSLQSAYLEHRRRSGLGATVGA